MSPRGGCLVPSCRRCQRRSHPSAVCGMAIVPQRTDAPAGRFISPKIPGWPFFAKFFPRNTPAPASSRTYRQSHAPTLRVRCPVGPDRRAGPRVAGHVPNQPDSPAQRGASGHSCLALRRLRGARLRGWSLTEQGTDLLRAASLQERHGGHASATGTDAGSIGNESEHWHEASGRGEPSPPASGLNDRMRSWLCGSAAERPGVRSPAEHGNEGMRVREAKCPSFRQTADGSYGFGAAPSTGTGSASGSKSPPALIGF